MAIKSGLFLTFRGLKSGLFLTFCVLKSGLFLDFRIAFILLCLGTVCLCRSSRAQLC